MNIEVVDKDKPDNHPDISKPSGDEKTPSNTKDSVKTGDRTSIAMSLMLMIITGRTVIVMARKKHKKSKLY